jgi:hypothetical protein
MVAAVVTAERWQCNGSSAATAAWQRWQRSGSAAAGNVAVVSASAAAEWRPSMAAVLAARWWWRWQHASGGLLGSCGGSLAAL